MPSRTTTSPLFSVPFPVQLPESNGSNSTTPTRATGSPCTQDFDPSMIRTFLKNIDFPLQRPIYRPTPGLSEAVHHAIFDNYLGSTLPLHTRKSILKIVPLAIQGADMMLPPNRSMALRVYLAVYIALFLYVDDIAVADPKKSLPELRKLAVSWSLGTSENDYDDPVLQLWYQHTITETPKHYGPYAAGAIIKGSLDFVLGCLFEGQYTQQKHTATTTAAWFLRKKAGAGEVFAQFVFSEEAAPESEYLEHYFPIIPEISDWTDAVNDILSYYKEAVVGEETNYITGQAEARQCTPLEIFEETCEATVELTKKIYIAVREQPSLKDCIESYFEAYLVTHIMQPRYRLRELGIAVGE